MKFFACVCVRLANRNSQLRPVNTTTTCAHKLNTASKQVNKPIARAYFDTSCKHARYNAKCSHQLLARKPHTYMSTYPSTTHAPLTLMLSCMAVDAMQYHSISCLSFAFTVSPQPPDKFNFYLLPTQPTGSKDTHNQTPVQAKYNTRTSHSAAERPATPLSASSDSIGQVHLAKKCVALDSFFRFGVRKINTSWETSARCQKSN